MSKRKVRFDEDVETKKACSEDAELEKAFNEAGGSGDVDKTKSKDLNTRFKEKHSLDSDEEDNPDKYDVMNDDDIEGQEDATLEFDEGIKITPFNMEEELEEGHFDAEGTYIFNKEKEIHDSWMDNIDWVKVKAQEEKQTRAVGEGADEDSDDDDDADNRPVLDEIPIFKEMVAFMKPGESVAKALRRLGGGKAGMSSASASQRWKKKKQTSSANGEGNKSADTGNKEHMLKLTGLADQLVQSGNMEIYQDTYEKLCFKIEERESKKTAIPDGADSDDALDIFAEGIDKKEGGDKKEESKTEKTAATPASNEVHWNYKWKSEDTEIHGPFSSTEMMEWQEEGFFKEGVLVRKVGQEGDFYSSKRIDFELYT